MWVIENCLRWGSACDPKSWADFLEMLGTLLVLLAAVIALLLFLEWLDDLF